METIGVPAEIGGKRLVLFTVREKGTCKDCGEAILRVSNATVDTWIHERRAQGQNFDHAARPAVKHGH